MKTQKKDIAASILLMIFAITGITNSITDFQPRIKIGAGEIKLGTPGGRSEFISPRPNNSIDFKFPGRRSVRN